MATVSDEDLGLNSSNDQNKPTEEKNTGGVRHSKPTEEDKNTIDAPTNRKGKVKKKHFFGSVPELQEAANYGVKQIILPRTKDMLFDLASAMLESFIYPDPLTRPSRNLYTHRQTGYIRTNTAGQTPYNKQYMNAPQNQAQPVRQQAVTSMNHRLGLDDLDFELRQDAEKLKTKMLMMVEEYGKVNVDFVYGEIGQNAPSTGYYWGWKKPLYIRIEQLNDGWWRVCLPEVTRL